MSKNAEESLIFSVYFRIGLSLFETEFIVRIQCFPPCRLIFKPMGKPGEDYILPGQPLIIISDNMVFTVNLYVAHRTSQYTQCREQLLAFIGRDIGIYRSVKKQ